MTRIALVLAGIAASATCGPRPAPMPWDVQHVDAGSEWDGGEDGGLPPLARPDCRPCETWGAVEIRGPLPGQLDELSGLAVSAKQPGVVFAHNDSGDSPRLFALDSFGRLLAELRLPGAQAVDWEDMAAGPCGNGQRCLFLGDIGDNLRQRTSYTLYRVLEPLVPTDPQAQAAELSLPFDRLPFIYPNNERHNAETLLVHPVTGEVYIVTKETAGTPSRVFRFPSPLTPEAQMTLIDLGPASVPQPSDVLVTGGAIHPCGGSVLLRLYNRVVELRAAPDAGFETVFRAAPVEAPSAIDEPQGEAVTWGVDGQSYFTASEHTGQSLHRVQCVRSP